MNAANTPVKHRRINARIANQADRLGSAEYYGCTDLAAPTGASGRGTTSPSTPWASPSSACLPWPA